MEVWAYLIWKCGAYLPGGNAFMTETPPVLGIRICKAPRLQSNVTSTVSPSWKRVATSFKAGLPRTHLNPWAVHPKKSPLQLSLGCFLRGETPMVIHAVVRRLMRTLQKAFDPGPNSTFPQIDTSPSVSFLVNVRQSSERIATGEERVLASNFHCGVWTETIRGKKERPFWRGKPGGKVGTIGKTGKGMWLISLQMSKFERNWAWKSAQRYQQNDIRTSKQIGSILESKKINRFFWTHQGQKCTWDFTSGCLLNGIDLTCYSNSKLKACCWHHVRLQNSKRLWTQQPC